MKRKQIIITLYTTAALMLIVFLGLIIKGKNQQIQINQEQAPQVKLMDLSSLEANTNSINAAGEVESISHVDLKSEVFAKIKNIYVELGDLVLAGEFLLEFVNDELQAQLLRAQAMLEAEQASLQEMQKGARSEEIKLAEQNFVYAQTSLENTKNKAQIDLENLNQNIDNILVSAFVSASDAVNKQTDEMFDNDNSQSPQITFLTADTQSEIDSEWQRFLSKQALNNIRTDLPTAKENLIIIRNFLNRLLDALNKAVALDQIILDKYRSQVIFGLNNINASINAISSQEQAIEQQKTINNQNINLAQTQFHQAKLQLELLLSGVAQEQINRQKASVKSARAQVQDINAKLAKTIIYSPISGTVAFVGASKGELISNGQLVISVVNTEQIRIIAFLDSKEFQKIKIDNKVVINNKFDGKIINIAPSLNPITKKAEIIISTDANLLVGQFVDVEILTNNLSSQLLVPLQAVNILPDKKTVFIIENNILREKEIQTGQIIGNQIEILSGLENINFIVSQAAGLTSGQEVVISPAH